MVTSEFSVFEYLYRDAGNYKAWGRLLLRGRATPANEATIRAALESGDYFFPEQVGVPPLQAQLWAKCGTGFDDDMDHVWHEFFSLREARAAEVAGLGVHGRLADLVLAFASIAKSRVSLSLI